MKTRHAFLAGLLLAVSVTSQAQDLRENSRGLYLGCDQRAPAAGSAPAAPVVDQGSNRTFANVSMNGGSSDASCWNRLDGLWQARHEVSLDESKIDEGIWGAEGPALLRLANGNYTRPTYLVIVKSPGSDDALYVATGLDGGQFVRFQSNDNIPMSAVLVRAGRSKTYTASERFPYGSQLRVSVPESGRLELNIGNQSYFRPTPLLSASDASGQDPMMQAFLLSQTLSFMDANRRGYDIATQDPFYLYENDKQPIFAELSRDRVYLQDQKVIPANFHYLPDSAQGTIYRKSLISSEKDIQETASQTLGASLKYGASPATPDGLANASFSHTKSTSSSMSQSNTKAQAVGYSRQKKYALVMDHAFSELSADFIDAVGRAQREHRYQALINQFGTHYPYAVTYGANARMTMDLDENAYATRIGESSGFSASAGATVYGVTGEVNVSEQSSKSTGMKGSMSNEKVTFVAVGGNGSWDQNGYSAGEDHVPILLDLRPISELLNPINFPGRPDIYVTVRNNLDQAIDRHLVSFGKDEPISAENWTDGIEPFVPYVEPVERWFVYVRRIWCGGAGSGRVKTALVRRLEITGTVSGKSPVSTVKSDGMETECKYKHSRKSFSYSSTDNGLIVLTGTRREMNGTTIDINLDWSYNSNTNKKRSDSFTLTGMFPASMKDEETRDHVIEVKGSTLATFSLQVRSKRKR